MFGLNGAEHISPKNVNSVLTLIDDIYGAAEEIVDLIEKTENPVARNVYVAAIDNAIEMLDRSLRAVVSDYSKILKSRKIDITKSRKIAQAISEIGDTVQRVRKDISSLE